MFIVLLQKRIKSLTVNNKGEVAITESRVWDENAALVEGVVDPLVGPRWHVQDSFHRIFRAAADQVPVHHPLTVLQSVPDPHHAGAVTGQDGIRSRGKSDVLRLHHCTKSAAAALSPSWHSI